MKFVMSEGQLLLSNHGIPRADQMRVSGDLIAAGSWRFPNTEEKKIEEIDFWGFSISLRTGVDGLRRDWYQAFQQNGSVIYTQYYHPYKVTAYLLLLSDGESPRDYLFKGIGGHVQTVQITPEAMEREFEMGG